MKTLVVGSGIIGTIYGWALAEAGVDVTWLVRPGHGAGEELVRLDVLDDPPIDRASRRLPARPAPAGVVLSMAGMLMVHAPTLAEGPA